MKPHACCAFDMWTLLLLCMYTCVCVCVCTIYVCLMLSVSLFGHKTFAFNHRMNRIIFGCGGEGWQNGGMTGLLARDAHIL